MSSNVQDVTNSVKKRSRLPERMASTRTVDGALAVRRRE
jgi:hypothetical protein